MHAESDVPQPRWWLWGSAAALGAGGTALLFQALPGINWTIATFAAAAGFLVCCAADRKHRAGIALPLALAALLSVGAMLTADPMLDVLIAAAVLSGLGAAVMAAYAETHRVDGRLRLLIAAPLAPVVTAGEAGRQFTETLRALHAGRSMAVIRGLVIAVPLSLVLARLLSEADPTLAAARAFLIHLLRELPILPRGMFFAVLTVCLAGAFGIALKTASGSSPGVLRARAAPQILGEAERLIVLGSIAALFALFLLLQVSYLFGNPGGQPGSGVSYADAVHRGFVELTVASTLCCLVLLSLRRYARGGVQTTTVRALEWIVTIQGQILLLSAFHRVDLYEAAYGFTRLRLYVQVYAAGAFVGFILLSLELHGAPSVDRLLRRVSIVAALAVAGLIGANSDAAIAHANLVRYGRTGRIDVPYLTQRLGPDTVPALVAELPHLPGAVARQIRECLRSRYASAAPAGEARWFEWSLRRTALDRALAALEAEPGAATAAQHPSGCP
jgi:two-component system, OmpR family, sensor histidine kinase BaeS